jgi:hypothetical protein
MRKSLMLTAVLSAATLPLVANAGWTKEASHQARPMFLSLNHPGGPHAPGTPQLPQWNGSFTDRTGKQVTFTMLGGDPAKTAATHVSVLLVPVIAVYGADNGNKTFDPRKHKEDENGQTVIQNVANSPLFTSNIDYIQGGTDLGTTQFLDAFQRGNFWKSVKRNSGYHLLYDVTVGNAMKILVAKGEGAIIQNPYGAGKVGTFDWSLFDQDVQSFIASQGAMINPGVLPLFVSWNVFLAEGGECCIGGYHTATSGPPGGQAYAFGAYIDAKTTYAEDISAVAVELGQLTDDPFEINRVNCTNTPSLNVAAGLSEADFYPYTENGYTYHLPSLEFVTYFGAPKATSVNRWYNFQGEQKHACPGQ